MLIFTAKTFKNDEVLPPTTPSSSTRCCRSAHQELHQALDGRVHASALRTVARELDFLGPGVCCGVGTADDGTYLGPLQVLHGGVHAAHRTEVIQGYVTCGKRAGLQGTSRLWWGLDCRRGAGCLPRTTSSFTWWSPCCPLERRHTRVCHHWQESWASKVPEDYCGCGDCSCRKR